MTLSENIQMVENQQVSAKVFFVCVDGSVSFSQEHAQEFDTK